MRSIHTDEGTNSAENFSMDKTNENIVIGAGELLYITFYLSEINPKWPTLSWGWGVGLSLSVTTTFAGRPLYVP